MEFLSSSQSLLYDIDLSCRMIFPICRSNNIRDVKSSQQRVRTETGYFPVRYAELKSSVESSLPSKPDPTNPVRDRLLFSCALLSAPATRVCRLRR